MTPPCEHRCVQISTSVILIERYLIWCSPCYKTDELPDFASERAHDGSGSIALNPLSGCLYDIPASYREFPFLESRT
jgi:hypothetical protein